MTTFIDKTQMGNSFTDKEQTNSNILDSNINAIELNGLALNEPVGTVERAYDIRRDRVGNSTNFIDKTT